MHRNDLLELLNDYHTSVISEAGYVHQTKQFVAAYDDCFHSDLFPGHITGSAWVVSPARDKVLMLHHKKQDQWFQPGGHADRDSDIRRVALRETSEETGLAPESIKLVSDRIFDVDIHFIPASIHGGQHYHYDIRFLLEVDDSLEIPGNDESHEIRWVDLSHTQHFNRNLSTFRMMEKTRRLKNSHNKSLI